MNTPLVSVVLTLYEIKPEYLNECLNSILNQTYKNIEIIAINDCSPNINYDYITEISPKIKLVKNEINLGMNKSVNKAFSLVSGKYVVRLGSDDIFDKTLFEKEVKLLESDDSIGAVCCNLQRFGKANGLIRRPRKWDLYDVLSYGNIKNFGYAGGMMFRSSLLKVISINESYRMCEDFDFHIQILEQMPIKSIDETLYFYRSHETNLCKSVKKAERHAINEDILNKHRILNNITKKHKYRY